MRVAPEVVFQLLGADDEAILKKVEDGVFDRALQPELIQEFLTDSRHHIAVAIEDGSVVAMATGFHYIHPDKEPQLFINEVGVAPGCRFRGIASGLLSLLMDHGRKLGCSEAWVLTDQNNVAAQVLYSKQGGERPVNPPLMYSFPLKEVRLKAEG